MAQILVLDVIRGHAKTMNFEEYLQFSPESRQHHKKVVKVIEKRLLYMSNDNLNPGLYLGKQGTE